MPDANVEVLRGAVNAHDKAIADTIAVRKELVTAKAEITRLKKLIAAAPTAPGR